MAVTPTDTNDASTRRLGVARTATSGAGGFRGRLARWRRLLLLLSPSIVAALYLSVVASERYVSEAQFVVRTASKPVGAGAFGTFLQMSGLTRANDDSFTVESFIGSRDALRELVERLPMREIYGREDADFLTRYPSVLYGSSLESFHRYLAGMIRTSYSSTSGITTLRVQAFRAADAKSIADELLALSEQTINRMNERIQADAIRSSLRQVKEFEQRLVDAQIAITQFRNKELMVDPGSSSFIITEVIARLTAERAAAETRLRELISASPDNPALATVKRQIKALEEAINNERLKISDASGGLATKIARFERLALEREFAKTGLTTAQRSLEQARTEARRQQLYIEHVVRPNLPDEAILPERLKNAWTAFSLNLVFLLLGWLFYSGIREHGAGG